MPKEIYIQQKREWLSRYENGTSIKALATKYKRSQPTITKGLEDARRDRDSQSARTELMKEALGKHQLRLQEGLQSIVSTYEVADNFTPLSWYEGEGSIFDVSVNKKKLLRVPGISLTKGRPVESTINVNEMLRQHFRGDKMWKLLVEWEKAVLSYAEVCSKLQTRLVYLLRTKTGYSLQSEGQAIPPYLCSYTVGPFLYELALVEARGNNRETKLDDEIVADTQSGSVRRRGSIFAEVPGNEEKCRLDIINAYRELKTSSAFTDIRPFYEKMNEIAEKAQQAITEITYLEYIPGVCNICKRLGM